MAAMTMITGTKPELSAAEVSLEVARERIDPDAFDRLGVAMQNVELTATLRISEVLPIGGLVAGADEARLLYEGFEQHLWEANCQSCRDGGLE